VGRKVKRTHDHRYESRVYTTCAGWQPAAKTCSFLRIPGKCFRHGQVSRSCAMSSRLMHQGCRLWREACIASAHQVQVRRLQIGFIHWNLNSWSALANCRMPPSPRLCSPLSISRSMGSLYGTAARSIALLYACIFCGVDATAAEARTFAVVVHPDNPKKDMSLEHLRKVFKAETQYW
jgi:hypothetical protein